MKNSSSLTKFLLIFIAIVVVYVAIEIFLMNKDYITCNLFKSKSNETELVQEDLGDEQLSEYELIMDELSKYPPRPIAGKLMGVVELGASGFNSFIIRKDSDDNWEKSRYEWGSSMIIDGLATQSDIIKGLKKYIANILDYGVEGGDIHFVVSSGASKEKSAKNIIKALKVLGFVVNVVTEEQEGEYALKSVLPSTYHSKAFVVDMGSSNTKISWMNDRRVKTLATPASKYYKKNISQDYAYEQNKNAALEIPVELSKICFIIGGVPYELANSTRNGNERYTILDKPSAYSELGRSKGRKVSSGLKIYEGIIEGSDCNKFLFDWDANFAIGFLLALPG